jgi:hypothetical protein
MKFENNYIVMEYMDGLVIAKYKPHVFIDAAIAKEIVEARQALTNYTPHCVLVEGGPIEISADARKYALTKESSSNIIAWAIISKMSLFKSVFLKLLYFTQGKWNQIRFFDNREEGVAWLSEQIGAHQRLKAN